MSTTGLTRACTIGSILDALDKAGGSVSRVFRQADLSPRLVDDPKRLIFLKDQFALLEAASREIGDAALAARLSLEAGINGLGAYGFLVVSQPTLRDALLTAQAMLPIMLQTGTKVALTVEGRWAHWNYEVEDGAVRGRRENELLCTGYVLYVFRRFAGPNWVPHRHAIPSRRIDARAAIETLFGCTLSHGETTRLTFPADLLDCPNTAPSVPKPFEPMPTACDPPALVAYAIEADLGGDRPDLVRIARRLGFAPRTLQRRLETHGTTFEHVLDAALSERARELMTRPSPMPLAAISYELGFAAPSHFTRAFKRWTGLSPTAWRGTNDAKW